FPPDPYVVKVDMGAGDDVVSMHALADPHGPAGTDEDPWVFSAVLGAGDDMFAGEIDFQDAPTAPPPSDPPAPGMRILGAAGAGNDDVTLRTRMGPSEPGLVAPNSPAVDFTADLGDGNDRCNIDVVAAIPSKVTVHGGAGDDGVTFRATVDPSVPAVVDPGLTS